MEMASLPFAVWLLLLGGLALGFRAYLRRWRPMRLVTIIDGDTYIAIDTRGKRRKLRLQDVDCPELSQRNGREAQAFGRAVVGKSYVQVQLRGRDRYRRHLARIRVQGDDLSLALVRAGLAYPLADDWRLRGAAFRAALARKGVHSGFGQAKPWQSWSRSSWVGRWLTRYKRKTSCRRR